MSSRAERPPRFAAVPYTLVFLGVLAGLGVVALYGHQRGLPVIAGSLLAGAVLRAVLPGARAGLLAVRGRVLDVLTLTGLAALILGAPYLMSLISD
ncbi:DUF3017 domain-containing protein [Bailinhaonella thermotolerans]|uniref:DUF3017 domain-containing protein n=1 Tax=Bailinhaonella thermotolerans TaxID=1070861 RepID=A0A3A4AVZ7_9ACTN|nr:DUF3017 domain-containing protein [Bailinhaonella thermotolerans]RJL23652.1 DUF3017 domain-containing protein [Bailinhaonella thermotolerans]